MRSAASTSPTVRPPGAGMKLATIARLEHVDVERDVDRVDAVERTVEVVVDPVLRDVLELRLVEVAGTDERDVLGPHAPLLDRHAQRHPPLVPGRRGLGRVEVAVRVEPDDAEPAVTGCEAADRADVRAATAAEHERALRQALGERGVLLVERLAVDDQRLGVRERGRGRLHHRLAPAPQARGTRTSPAANAAPQLWHS